VETKNAFCFLASSILLKLYRKKINWNTTLFSNDMGRYARRSETRVYVQLVWLPSGLLQTLTGVIRDDAWFVELDQDGLLQLPQWLLVYHWGFLKRYFRILHDLQ
jgi:hypothetical protein